jgi:hypothetical protein
VKKIIILLIASVLGFGVAAHAADANTKESAQQAQVKKLRAQADKAHKKGDALTAKADKLESQAAANPGEKMRGCDYNNGPGCVVTAGGQRPSPDVVHNPSPVVNDSGRRRTK